MSGMYWVRRRYPTNIVRKHQLLHCDSIRTIRSPRNLISLHINMAHFRLRINSRKARRLFDFQFEREGNSLVEEPKDECAWTLSQAPRAPRYELELCWCVVTYIEGPASVANCCPVEFSIFFLEYLHLRHLVVNQGQLTLNQGPLALN